MGPIPKTQPRQEVVARLIAMMETAKRMGADVVVYTEAALTAFFPHWWIEDEDELDSYFERETSRMIARQALELVEALEQFDIMTTVKGGGHSAQAEAIRHGISRALCLLDPEKRTVLKRAGFLTRDARKKERKKYGQPGARKRFQYSKR